MDIVVLFIAPLASFSMVIAEVCITLPLFVSTAFFSFGMKFLIMPVIVVANGSTALPLSSVFLLDQVIVALEALVSIVGDHEKPKLSSNPLVISTKYTTIFINFFGFSIACFIFKKS